MTELRFAAPSDAEALLDIYGCYMDTGITFEYTLPSREEFTRRITDISRDYPYLVWEADGRALGYAYAHRAFERAAYQWCAELSVYLRPDACRQGLGRVLYETLMDMLRLQGVRTVYGVVTSPNPPSEALHDALGFHRVGLFPRAGFKGGAWRDVSWFQKEILPYDTPAPLRSIRDVPPEALSALLETHRPK